MKKSILIFAGLLFIAACGGSKQEPERAAHVVLFPSADVCGLPSASSAKALRELGGGTWASANPAEPGSSFECVGSNPEVRLLADGSSVVLVEYTVTGSEQGASMITAAYTSSGSGPTANESTYRKVFANFVDTLTERSLGTQPPELLRKKLANLNSYSKPGRGSSENFDIGNGFVLITREQSDDKNEINVTVKLFPDVGLKLEL